MPSRLIFQTSLAVREPIYYPFGSPPPGTTGLLTDLQFRPVQIPVWFSITPRIRNKPFSTLPAGLNRWAALVDPGTSHTFYLGEEHTLNYDLERVIPNPQ